MGDPCTATAVLWLLVQQGSVEVGTLSGSYALSLLGR